jgi:hypothetical protein
MQQKNNKIAEYMGICWLQFPSFGKADSALATLIPVYHRSLERFSLEQIEYAFQKWIDGGDSFPLPKNLIEIIEPPKEKLSPVVYMQLKKFQAGGGYIWEDDKLQFLKDFEAQEMGKMPGSQVAQIKQDIENYRLEHQRELSDGL